MADKWLITGGCGFIGANLAASLLDDGVEVVALDDLSRIGSAENLAWLRERSGRVKRGRFTHLRADTSRQEQVEAALSEHRNGLTAVAHLAGQVAMTTSIAAPRRDFEVNALGALNVLEAVRAHAPEAVVLFSSTNKVYGDLAALRHVEAGTRWTLPDHPAGLDESLPMSFHTPYGCSKGTADQYVLDYHRTYGLRASVFRHSSIYGGRQFATFDQGWVGWFTEQVLTGKHFTISGDGKQVRDLLHAEDLVACYRLGAAQIDACMGRAFNIGGGMNNSLSLIELFAKLERLTGKKASFELIPWRASDQKVFVADTRAARDAFGWMPEVGCDEGLRRMVEWVRSTMSAMP